MQSNHQCQWEVLFHVIDQKKSVASQAEISPSQAETDKSLSLSQAETFQVPIQMSKNSTWKSQQITAGARNTAQRLGREDTIVP